MYTNHYRMFDAHSFVRCWWSWVFHGASSYLYLHLKRLEQLYDYRHTCASNLANKLEIDLYFSCQKKKKRIINACRCFELYLVAYFTCANLQEKKKQKKQCLRTNLSKFHVCFFMSVLSLEKQKCENINKQILLAIVIFTLRILTNDMS